MVQLQEGRKLLPTRAMAVLIYGSIRNHTSQSEFHRWLPCGDVCTLFPRFSSLLQERRWTQRNRRR